MGQPASCYEQLLLSTVHPPDRDWQSDFSVQPDRLGWRLYDGAEAIALFMPVGLDIWKFSPFAQAEMANCRPPRRVVDLHTVHNTMINFGATGWPAHWLKAAPEPEKHLRWEWLQTHGERLLARVTAPFPDGRIVWNLSVEYDPDFGRYRYRFHVEAEKTDPAGFEMLNMMMAGAVRSRPQNRRWTHSVWEAPGGVLRRMVHSNALFFATEYVDRMKRTRPLTGDRPWIAYAAHESFNPVFLFHASSVPLLTSTCSQLFDEHVIWTDADREHRGRDGRFRFSIDAELVNVPFSTAQAILDQATDPVRDVARLAVALPFEMDRVNDLEAEIDPWAPHGCPVLIVKEDVESAQYWDESVACTGRRSIRLSGRKDDDRVEIFPVGAPCEVEPDSTYRFSAMARTEEVTAGARLELSAYEYLYDRKTATAQSSELRGNSGWTELSVVLPSGDAAYLMPRMQLRGKGRAWFDRLTFARVS